MSLKSREMSVLAAAFVLLCLAVQGACAQDPSESLPNPYRAIDHWGTLPEGRTWGSVSGISIDSKGNIWAFERCGANTCAGSSAAPILEFDPSGKLLKSFGAGMFVLPHALYVGSEGQRVGRGQRWERWQGPSGHGIQPRRKFAADAGHARGSGLRAEHFQSSLVCRGRAEWRHLCLRWARRQYQCASREIFQGWEVY